MVSSARLDLAHRSQSRTTSCFWLIPPFVWNRWAKLLSIRRPTENLNMDRNGLAEQSFWRNVAVAQGDGCWPYVGRGSRGRYGHVRITFGGRREYAHRGGVPALGWRPDRRALHRSTY